VEDYIAALRDRGFAWIPDAFPNADRAFEAARALIDARCAADGESCLTVISDFVIPPLDAGASRDFQTLHFDFGLPLDPKVDADVGRFTALHIPSTVRGVSAVTRLVPLAGLLSQRAWPSSAELLDGLIAYGRTHGAWDDARGYVEGSLARVVEAAAGGPPRLASVKLDPDFLCGLEFDSLRSELAFFERHGLRVEDVQVEVALRPGELLVFDNLALAHGRSGARRPGELRQRVYGRPRLSPGAQCELRDRLLRLFAAAAQAELTRPEPSRQPTHRSSSAPPPLAFADQSTGA
jgi:hypothetical protein